MFMRVVEVFW